MSGRPAAEQDFRLRREIANVTVVAPVRYPLSKRSKQTLRSAIEIARERELSLTVLHVTLYQNGGNTSRRDLKAAVERTFGPVEFARYVVREGLLVEETILEEIHAEDADVVVIGSKQAGRWRRMLDRVFDGADVERHLRRELDCEVVTVSG